MDHCPTSGSNLILDRESFKKSEVTCFCYPFIATPVVPWYLYTADPTSLARVVGKVAVYRVSVNCTAALCFFLQLFFIFPPVLFFPTEIVILTSSLWPTLVVYWYTATLAHQCEVYTPHAIRCARMISYRALPLAPSTIG